MTFTSQNLKQKFFSHPGHLIRRAYQIFSAIFDEQCREFDIKPVQLSLLVVLDAYPGSNQAFIGDTAGIDRASCSRGIDILVKRGLIIREQDQHDRRNRILSLTDTGQQMVKQLDQRMLNMRERFSERLNGDELEDMVSALQMFVSRYNDLSRAPAK